MKHNLIACLTAFAIATSFVGCGNAKEEKPAQSTTPDYLVSIAEINAMINEEKNRTATETEKAQTAPEAEETQPAPETHTTERESEQVKNGNENKDNVLVPDIEVNVSSDIDFSIVKINNIDVNIQGTTLKDVLDSTGIKRCPYGTTSLSKTNYKFMSGMFGIQTDENDITSFEGTQVSIEVIDKDGNLILQSDQTPSEYDKYTVKGIHISDFFTKDDFEVVFCKGIKVGMSKSDITDILGKETVVDNRAVYNNGSQTLIIEYEMGEVDEITLLNN